MPDVKEKHTILIAFVKSQKEAKLIFNISRQDGGFRETGSEQWGNSGFSSAGNILILDLDAKSIVTTTSACTFLSLCYNLIKGKNIQP